jgi:hypothetical protein
MTNEEPSNIQPSLLKILSEHECDYNATDIGRLYNDFRELNQGQLQKALLRCSNERKKLLKKFKDVKYNWPGVNQHIFKLTVWNETKEDYETPASVLRPALKWSDPCILSKRDEFFNKQKEIFVSWYNLSEIHMKEMEDFYQERKRELVEQQRLTHMDHANEKVVCMYCNANVARTNLSRHQKTNKRCLSLSQMTNAEP